MQSEFRLQICHRAQAASSWSDWDGLDLDADGPSTSAPSMPAVPQLRAVSCIAAV